MSLFNIFKKKKRKIELREPKWRMEVVHDLKTRPLVSIRYFYNFCNDIEQIRYFYTGLIGLEEIFYQNEEQNSYLVYKCDGFSMVWFVKEKAEIVNQEWSLQPGYQGGKLERNSWSIEVSKENFTEIVLLFKKSKFKCLTERSEIRQERYWGFTVLDPMGNTVEIFCYDK